ncbi:MAG: PhzF family phenazine biosynthesis protein [Pseudomonadota bacterium]
MAQYKFEILDVFTDQSRAGNQLAVVHGADGLDQETMQSVAREFGFSETVFLCAAESEAHSAAIRIFTPGNELPFAGHPTVGAALAVARAQGMDTVGHGIVVLEEKVGPVRCGVRFDDSGAYAEFDLPALAERFVPPGSKEDVALALGLTEQELGFENHVLSQFDAGLPYTLVPVRDLMVAAKARPVMAHWHKAFGDHSHNSAFVYCRETVAQDNQFHARMFAPDAGIPEDPATGSAVASFAGAVALFDGLPDGPHTVRVEQGMEMGRPSLITLELDMKDGAQVGGRIGGHAVTFATGEISI